MNPEFWKSVLSYDGRYEVSDRGRVRSLRSHNNVVECVRCRPKILVAGLNPGGRLQVHLGRGQTRRVHRLVLEAFRGPCPNGHEASHLNGNAVDNRLENLTWESHKVNNLRRREHGTFSDGEGNGQARLNADAVMAIRRRYAAGGVTHRELAKEYGVTHPTIGQLLRGKAWHPMEAKPDA